MGNADIEALLVAARAELPDVTVDDAAFYAAVTEQLADAKSDAERTARLATLDAAEIYLACGCEQADARALAHFESKFFPVIDLALAPMKLAGGIADDVRQIVRTKLFVAEPGEAPKIRGYAGKGSLEGLVRVIATRAALDITRKAKRAVPIDAAEEILAIDVAPELEIIKRRYRSHFKQAFNDAIDGLSARDRTILKLNVIDRMSIDEIGALYGVHRATAARWLEAIRDGLGEKTRELLRERLSLEPSELESVVRVVQSQVSVTLSRLAD